MLTEQDYRAVLEELGFDLQHTPEPNRGRIGRALRHTIRRFIDIPHRQVGDNAFWPTVYWNRSKDYIYFSTAHRDADHFRSLFWAPAHPDCVLPHEQETNCFVPLAATRAGLRLALESLFLARPNW